MLRERPKPIQMAEGRGGGRRSKKFRSRQESFGTPSLEQEQILGKKVNKIGGQDAAEFMKRRVEQKKAEFLRNHNRRPTEIEIWQMSLEIAQEVRDRKQ